MKQESLSEEREESKILIRIEAPYGRLPAQLRNPRGILNKQFKKHLSAIDRRTLFNHGTVTSWQRREQTTSKPTLEAIRKYFRRGVAEKKTGTTSAEQTISVGKVFFIILHTLADCLQFSKMRLKGK